MSAKAQKYLMREHGGVCDAYVAYFQRPIRNLRQPWTPNFACKACYTPLLSKYYRNWSDI